MSDDENSINSINSEFMSDNSNEYKSDNSGEYISDFFNGDKSENYDVVSVSNKFDLINCFIEEDYNEDDEEEDDDKELNELRDLYDNYQSMKKFYAEHTTTFNDKSLYYKNDYNDYINIGSLNNINTAILKKYYIKSTYGNYETGLNEYNINMRKSFEIDLKKIYKMETFKKMETFTQILHSDLNIDLNTNFVKKNNKVYKSVIVNNPYYYEPYKLIIYEEGCFFKRHTDSLSSKNMIGTLIYGLTDNYEGGEFVVYNNSDKKTFKITKNKWIFIYGNCPHEVLPVKSGTRITMTFKIFKNLNNLSEQLSLSTYDKLNIFINKLKLVVDEKIKNDYSDIRYYFSMCYDYTSINSFKELNKKFFKKNNDFKEIENYLIDVDLLFFNKLKKTFNDKFSICITKLEEECKLEYNQDLIDTLISKRVINNYYLFKNSNSSKVKVVKGELAGNAIDENYYLYETYVIEMKLKSREELDRLNVNCVKSARNFIQN